MRLLILLSFLFAPLAWAQNPFAVSVTPTQVGGDIFISGGTFPITLYREGPCGGGFCFYDTGLFPSSSYQITDQAPGISLDYAAQGSGGAFPGFVFTVSSLPPAVNPRDTAIEKLTDVKAQIASALYVVSLSEPLVVTTEEIQTLADVRLFLEILDVGADFALSELPLGDLNMLRAYLSSPHKAPPGSPTVSIQQAAYGATVQAGQFNSIFAGPLSNLIVIFAADAWLGIELAVWHITDGIIAES